MEVTMSIKVGTKSITLTLEEWKELKKELDGFFPGNQSPCWGPGEKDHLPDVNFRRK